MSAMARCSSAVRALTKRAAAAEISPDMTESRSASVIIGTSWLATRWNSRSVAENETMPTPAAATVISATTPNAVCSLPLTPKRMDFAALPAGAAASTFESDFACGA